MVAEDCHRRRLVKSRLNLLSVPPLSVEPLLGSVRERCVMPRREHWPVLAGRVEDRLVALEGVDDPVGQRNRLSFASLSEHDGDPLFEIDVRPPEAVAVVVSWVGEQLGAASAGEREHRHDGPVSESPLAVVG